MNIAAELDRAELESSERPVLYFDGGQWTFADLDLRASGIATALEATGIRPGDRVAIAMLNVPEHVAAWYGIAKAGAVPVDLNIILADEEWAYILKDCAPSAILSSPVFADRLTAIAGALDPAPTVYTDVAALGAGTGRRPAVERADDDLAVLAYTSGTTGFPKGVMHNHGILRLQLEVVQEMNEFTRDDVLLQCTPLFPMHGFLCNPGTAVHCQCTLVLMDRFDPKVFAQKSRLYPITSAILAPAMIVALLALPEDDMPVLDHGRLFMAGGAALHPEVRDRFEETFGVKLTQGFGSTEVMGTIAMERPARRAPWGSCGQLQPRAEGMVRVVDDDGKDVAPGEVGEFVVHRERATMGYWQRPDLTDEAFIDGEWYRMGDIGRVDEEGFVYLLDRKKDMIIRGGFNIYSAEIERVLNEHDNVAEATVIGVAHERLGEVPKAFLVLQPGIEATRGRADDLRAYVVERLGSLKAPEDIEFVAFDDLPRNAMTKVLKRELRGGVVQ